MQHLSDSSPSLRPIQPLCSFANFAMLASWLANLARSASLRACEQSQRADGGEEASHRFLIHRSHLALCYQLGPASSSWRWTFSLFTPICQTVDHQRNGNTVHLCTWVWTWTRHGLEMVPVPGPVPRPGINNQSWFDRNVNKWMKTNVVARMLAASSRGQKAKQQWNVQFSFLHVCDMTHSQGTIVHAYRNCMTPQKQPRWNSCKMPM